MSTVVYAVCTNKWSDEAKPKSDQIVYHNGIMMFRTGRNHTGWPCNTSILSAVTHATRQRRVSATSLSPLKRAPDYRQAGANPRW